MKHYPVILCGRIKAAASVETSWNWATISIKVPHRKGQRVGFSLANNPKIVATYNDDYDTYDAIRFMVLQQQFTSELEAVKYCVDTIVSVHKWVNFDSTEELISKELLSILG